MNKHLLITAFIISFWSCKEEQKEIVNDLEPIASVFESYYEDELKLNPILATMQGDSRYNDTLPNFLSSKYEKQLRAHYTNYKSKMANYEDADLSKSEKMSKAILQWQCNINLEGLEFENYTPIDQMWSLNLMIGQLASGSGAQPFETVQDYENWLSRLEDYSKWLASAKIRMQEGIKIGNVLPKSLIKKVIPQLASVADTKLEDNLFYSPVKKFPKNFTDENKRKLSTDYSKIISQKIIPSYKSLLEFMNTDYLNAGRESSGIDAVSDGNAYYQHQIKVYTTTSLTADEIHEIGRSEVSFISAEMERVKNYVGFKGNLRAFFDYIRNKKELMPFSSPKEVIDNFKAIHEKMKSKIDSLFDKQPKTAFEIRRTEAFREASASAEYNPGSIDGTRAGIFYVPIPDAKKYNIYSDESLFLHEAIPGHHFQISLTQENESLPKFRKSLWYSAYGEGWALYTESLGRELGLYNDPYQYFGMLGAEMHRAIRLVVDTGLHAKEWTREQAIEYSLNNEAESEASITAEIERYMANPGQALSYKIGQMKIDELRQKAETTFRDKFEIREFHNQILETGCVPLALLETKIDNWISNSTAE